MPYRQLIGSCHPTSIALMKRCWGRILVEILETTIDKGYGSLKTSINQKISILKAISLCHHAGQTSLQMRILLAPAATLVLFAY